MKKIDWLLVFLPLFAVLIIDQITKFWALTLHEPHSFGILNFALHYNRGAFLGLFSDLPPNLRVVTLSTMGAFLVVIYAFFQYLLPVKSLTLRSGMSILLGGILGNVTDRVLTGRVTDFIAVGTQSTFLSPIFNLADAIQWIGYTMIIYSMTKEREKIWPEKNSRKKFWINPRFQLKYCYLLTGVGLSISLITIVFSYTYFQATISEIMGPNPQVSHRFLIPYLITFSFICIGFCMGLFVVGKIISHKIAGPIYSFEKYVGDLIAEDINKQTITPFKLRSHDEFKELEELARCLKEKLTLVQSATKSAHSKSTIK